SVTISGTATEDATLTVVTSTISDADDLGVFSYQWLRDGTDISGATASTYTLAQADVGAAISIRASYTDGGGTAESVTSSATGSIINVNDAPSGSITISGMASEGQVLTVDTSSLTDEDGLGALSYQWFANDETFVSSSPVELYQRSDDELFSYKLIGSANNEDGNGHYAFELTFYKQLDNNIVEKSEAPFEITAPFSNNFVSAGSFYEVSAGTAYELAPNTSTLTLTQSEVDKAITVKVSYTDAYGTAEELTSSASVAVVNVNDNPVGAVTISGVAAEGETLTAVTSSIADADGLGSFSYQWRRGDDDISGATNSSYTLTADDIGYGISVHISYTDGRGTTETLLSGSRTVAESLPAVITETVNLETGLTEKSTAFENTGNELATAVLFQSDGNGSGSVIVNLPSSISLATVGPAEAVNTTSAPSVLSSALNKISSLQNSEASARVETFVNSLPETSTLQIRTLTPQSASNVITEPLVISGSGNFSGNSVEAFVIDLSQLPSNTSVQLDNIEFAAIFGSAKLIGGAGSNVIIADNAVQYILLGEDDDILDAGGGNDTVGSAGGDDEVYGGEGNDIVFGGTGNDVVDGGSGDDEVRGDEGDDTLTGGSGSDTFVFRPGFGNDVVTDFNKTEDTLIFYDAAGELIESSQLNETQNSDSNAVLTAADGSSVTLQGVARYSPILEDLGAISVVNTGSGSNMVLEFYADDSLVGPSVNSFDAVVTFDTSKATYVSAEIDAYLGFPNETAGVINLSGVSLTGGSSVDPLFTISLTDLDTSQALAVYVSDVLVNGASVEGSTLLIGAPDTVDIAAEVTSPSGVSLPDVAVSFDDGSDVITIQTIESGLSNAAITNGSDILISGSLDYVSSSKSISSQDALDALRLAVGMDTQNGSSTAFDYIAADFNQDGKVTSSDALEILKYAVGLPTTEQAEWVFVDTNGDYSGVSKSNTNYTEGVSIDDLNAANLSGANLYFSDLGYADLTNADLTAANLYAHLDNVISGS
ncbi:pentapeptide repeat-containing protein, partial [bacterium]|nr:pentapeptide repeat-containing protein [bacterium]